MRAFSMGVMLLVAGAVACARSEERPGKPARARPHYLAQVPVIRRSVLTDTSGTPEVEYGVLRAAVTMDSVLTFYRRLLPAQGWQINADQSDSAQASLYAVRDSLTLWVQIRRIGPGETEYALTAAAGSGTKGPAAQP